MDEGSSAPPPGIVKWSSPTESVCIEKSMNPLFSDVPERTRAPAPSPKNTESRRLQSVIVEKVSAPITKILLYTPVLTNCIAVQMAYKAPEHTAEISNATAFVAFIFF